MSTRSPASRSAGSKPAREPEKLSLDESVKNAIAVGLKVAASLKLKMAEEANGTEKRVVNPGLSIRGYKKRTEGTTLQRRANAPRKTEQGRAATAAVPKQSKVLRVRSEKVVATKPSPKMKPQKIVPIKNTRR